MMVETALLVWKEDLELSDADFEELVPYLRDINNAKYNTIAEVSRHLNNYYVFKRQEHDILFAEFERVLTSVLHKKRDTLIEAYRAGCSTIDDGTYLLAETVDKWKSARFLDTESAIVGITKLVGQLMNNSVVVEH